jgi:GDP-L-fucose synthase
MKIYVAGHRGLVGSAVVKSIELSKKHHWIGKSSNELNLLDRQSTFEFLGDEKPDAVIMAAAKVGGIKSNSDFPVEFLTQNLQMQVNIIDGAHKFNIEKFIFLGSSCIYPKLSQQPIKEEYLLTGPLEPTNEPYAIAKIAGLKLIQAYRKEYGHNWISAMPTNIYGPHDNFDPDTSHVLPALIYKFHEAKRTNVKNVELWGTGTPRREFLHSHDLGDAILFLLENYSDSIPINVGAGSDISIFELARIIRGIVGYSGDINWNTQMPDGAPRKLLDSSRLTDLGWKPKIELSLGIKRTYEWFLNNNEISVRK